MDAFSQCIREAALKALTYSAVRESAIHVPRFGNARLSFADFEARLASQPVQECVNALAARPKDVGALAQLEALLISGSPARSGARSSQAAAARLVFAALARALRPARPTRRCSSKQRKSRSRSMPSRSSSRLSPRGSSVRTTGLTRAAIHLKLASLNELRLSNAEANRSARAAATASPRDLTALEALRRLHLQRKEWAALAEVLEKLARLHAALDDQLATGERGPRSRRAPAR